MKIPYIGIVLNGPNGTDTIELVDIIGHGGFGDVYKAVEKNSNVLYAVKFPRTIGFVSQGEITAFFNEAEAAKNLAHPNIVKVLHVETAHDVDLHYLVMEYLPDGTLKSFLDEIRNRSELVNSSLIKKWTNELIEGIGYINSKMLHRDLKLDNILIADGKLKIGDFGLSKIVNALTRTNTFKGVQHMLYKAPEGWRHETNNIQIDMYAMGIVLFQLATLQYPYELPHNHELFRDMHLYEVPKTIKSIRADLPSCFSQIVSRLMEKRPEDRFRDWDEVKSSLQACWRNYEIENPEDDKFAIIAERFSQEHQIQTKKRLEFEKQEAEKQETIQLNRYQRDVLIDELKSIISEFNENFPLAQIDVRDNRGVMEFYFYLPHNIDSLTLKFLDVTPPIILANHNWQISLAAYLVSKVGYGLNLLLCREHENDLYGNWYCCKVSQNPLMAKPRPLEPFAFKNNQDMQDHLAKSDEMMHSYQVNFSSDIRENFINLIEILSNKTS